jgi:hypothetical protein
MLCVNIDIRPYIMQSRLDRIGKGLSPIYLTRARTLMSNITVKKKIAFAGLAPHFGAMIKPKKRGGEARLLLDRS